MNCFFGFGGMEQTDPQTDWSHSCLMPCSIVVQNKSSPK